MSVFIEMSVSLLDSLTINPTAKLNELKNTIIIIKWSVLAIFKILAPSLDCKTGNIFGVGIKKTIMKNTFTNYVNPGDAGKIAGRILGKYINMICDRGHP